MASLLRGSRSASEYRLVLPTSHFSVNQIWSRPIRRSLAESPRIVMSCELNTSWARRGFDIGSWNRRISCRTRLGVKAGIEFIDQQDRPLGKRLDNRSDHSEPDERTERLIVRVKVNVAACALVDEA